MKSRSLQMTLLSLSIASLFVPNLVTASEVVKTDTTLPEGTVEKNDMYVVRGAELQGTGENNTNLNIKYDGTYAFVVDQGGQVSNFGQISVDGYTNLVNAQLNNIDELILNDSDKALWINEKQGGVATVVSVNKLTVKNGTVTLDAGTLNVAKDFEAKNSEIRVQGNDASLSVIGTLDADLVSVGKTNSEKKYDVDVGELLVNKLNLLGGADVDVGSAIVEEQVEITSGDLAVTGNLTVKGSVNSVLVKGGTLSVNGTLNAPDIRFHKDGSGSKATLGTVQTDTLWVNNNQDDISIEDLTVNTALELSAGKLTVHDGQIIGTGLVKEGATLNVTKNLSLIGKRLTVDGTYDSTGSLTLEKDSAAFINGNFKAEELIAKDLATIALQTKEFTVNQVTLQDGELRIRETADEVGVNAVSMEGSESKIQSWAGNATINSVKANGSSLIELYGLGDSSEAARLNIKEMAVSDGAIVTLDNATKFDESAVAFGSVELGKGAVLENVNNGPSSQGIEQRAFTNLTFEHLKGNQATIRNDAGGQIGIGEMTGANNTFQVADTSANQISILTNKSRDLTVTSSDPTYGNSMSSVDQGVAALAGTMDLGEESTEGMKVVIDANDMTGRIEALYDAQGNKLSQTEEVNETNRTLTAVANLPVVAWRAELNDLYKRMGDLRATPYKSGAWVRYNGGKLKWSDGDLENDFHMIQVGIDTMPTENNVRFGTAFSYTKGDADFDGGSADCL